MDGAQKQMAGEISLSVVLVEAEEVKAVIVGVAAVVGELIGPEKA